MSAALANAKSTWFKHAVEYRMASISRMDAISIVKGPIGSIFGSAKDWVGCEIN
jgi:hypothetical protein